MNDVLRSAITLFIYNKGNDRCVGLQRVYYSPDVMTNVFGRVETWTFAPRKLHTITKYALCMYPTFVMTPDRYNPAMAEKVRGNIIPEMDGIGRLLKVGCDEIKCIICSSLKLGAVRKLATSKLSFSTLVLNDDDCSSDLKSLNLTFNGKISKVFGNGIGSLRARAISKLFGAEFEIEFDQTKGIRLSGLTDLSDARVPDRFKRCMNNLTTADAIKFEDIDGISLLETDYVKALKRRFSDGKRRQARCN